ncbi:MAG TPA: hypothetical protein VM262_01300 [Acidimicrobiales bacterium]|nr:hypothetical protein [Acidimicrobiales bacterium]
MMRFEWDALRVGDEVVLHGPVAIAGGMVAGVVESVTARIGGNQVGIRLAGGDDAGTLVWSSWHSVHALAIEPTACWQCARPRAT